MWANRRGFTRILYLDVIVSPHLGSSRFVLLGQVSTAGKDHVRSFPQQLLLGYPGMCGFKDSAHSATAVEKRPIEGR